MDWRSRLLIPSKLPVMESGGMLRHIEDELRRMEAAALEDNGPEMSDDEARAAFNKALAYWLDRAPDAKNAFLFFYGGR